MPVAPHALAFLYAVDSGAAGSRRYYEVKAAKRLFRDGDDVQDLVKLLYSITEIAREYLTDEQVFDSLRQMTQADDEVPPHATYIGVGISSLDTPAGTWEQVQRQVSGALEIPGRCMATMTDGTRL